MPVSLMPMTVTAVVSAASRAVSATSTEVVWRRSRPLASVACSVTRWRPSPRLASDVVAGRSARPSSSVSQPAETGAAPPLIVPSSG